jgi:hypothetical protein
MRASEFVTEDSKKKIDASAISAIPGARIWPELDNSSPYAAYRFGVALAGAPDETMKKYGPVKQNMITLGYSDADDEITKAAGKTIGVKSRQFTPRGSSENDVSSVSPIAKPKKNQYGV